MIKLAEGDIFNYIGKVDIIVNPVNTVGVMGAGLAKQFKERYPNMFSLYQSLCEWGFCDIGQCHFYKEPDVVICNLPTKRHWRNPSEYEYIRLGLLDLKKFMIVHGLRSVVLPRLGCGLGGLDWNDVRKIIREVFTDYPFNMFIYVYD